MEPKPNLLSNVLIRVFLICVVVIGVRFAYIVTIRGESCDIGDFCFFSLPENLNFVTGVPQQTSSAVTVDDDPIRSTPAEANPRDLSLTDSWRNAVQYYSAVFQDLISDGYLSPTSKSLCVETPNGVEVSSLKNIGVSDSIGIHKKGSKPLVVSGQASHHPFDDNAFDFIFSGAVDKIPNPAEFASEVIRTLKPGGFVVVLTTSKDTYSLNSFIDLFSSCKFIRTRDIDGIDSSTPPVREIVLKKENEFVDDDGSRDAANNCSVPRYKRELVTNAEPLIAEEPLKPWITLKRNAQKIKYLPSMVDISFKRRYVYVDVGARSYGSSIVSWFKKQYPKQNKTFKIYAIEADKAFHEEYKYKKGVKLMPYAAWVRNETLFFEVNHGASREEEKEKGKGMGRIKSVNSSDSLVGDGSEIQGFDFADWLKNTVSEKDFVVMKMDVEGTEFDLIPRLFETGAICLIDEIFLECHYNRWQRCCPGKRSTKYEKTYNQCLDLFSSLRKSGVLVHQWW